MNFKNRFLTLLKFIGLSMDFFRGLSKTQNSLKHSQQKTLKKALLPLFQLNLFVSAFILQIPNQPLFEWNSSFKQSHSSEAHPALKQTSSLLKINVLNTAYGDPEQTKKAQEQEEATKQKEKAKEAKQEQRKKFVCDETSNLRETQDKIDNIEVEEGTFKSEKPDKSFRKFLLKNKRKCEELKTKKQDSIAQCKEAHENFKEAGSEFRKNCGDFVKRGAKCEEFVTGCAVCSSPEDKKVSYNCVQIHQKSKCPELAGPELEKARELVEDYEEKHKDITEELQELQKDLLRAEEELNQQLVEDEETLNESTSELKRDMENAKENLDSGFHSARQTISENLNEQIAKVQKEIDNQLVVAHSFENALTKAHREHSLEVQKINRECRAEALTRLMKYRNDRRTAIQNGTYKISFSQLLDKKRANFHQQDQARLSYYDKSCRKDRKQDFKNAELQYKDTLRRIEQKKIEYQKRIEIMKKRLAMLTQQASSQENSLIQQYVKGMSKSIDKFEKAYEGNLGNYNKRKQSLISNGTKQINRLKGLIAAKTQEQKQMEKSLVEQKGLVSYLKSKGVSTEEEDHRSYSDLSESLEDYDLAIDKNWSACNCEEDKDHPNCPSEETKKRWRKRKGGTGKR